MTYSTLRNQLHSNIELKNDWFSHVINTIIDNEDLVTKMLGTLNDDCILKVMQFLNLNELSDIAMFNGKCLQLSRKVASTLKINQSMITELRLLNFKHILNIFGDSVVDLTISLKSLAKIFFKSILPFCNMPLFTVLFIQLERL